MRRIVEKNKYLDRDVVYETLMEELPAGETG